MVKKNRPIRLKFPQLKLPKLPNFSTTTKAPNLISTLVPKMPNLGLKKFIGQQGGKVMDFVSGLFGRNQEKDFKDRMMTVNEELKDQGSIMSQGGQSELTQLEQVQMLLKSARDKPLL